MQYVFEFSLRKPWPSGNGKENMFRESTNAVRFVVPAHVMPHEEAVRIYDDVNRLLSKVLKAHIDKNSRDRLTWLDKPTSTDL